MGALQQVVAAIGSAAGGSSTLLDDLVAYWKLDEASGTRNDSVGSNHLTDNNAVTQAVGKVGNAAHFAKADSEYLSRATNPDLETGDIDFTFCAWVYLDSNSAGQVVAKDTNSPANSRDYTFDYLPGGLSFRFYINGGAGLVTTPGSVATATWYFLVAWHDAAANTVNIQLDNGTPQSATTGGAAPQVSAAEFRIGARQYVGNEDHFDGRIDEVGLWKRILTSDERTELYNGGVGLTYPF